MGWFAGPGKGNDIAEDSEQEISKLAELFPHSVELTKGQKTGPEGCWICMPCPTGIDPIWVQIPVLPPLYSHQNPQFEGIDR